MTYETDAKTAVSLSDSDGDMWSGYLQKFKRHPVFIVTHRSYEFGPTLFTVRSFAVENDKIRPLFDGTTLAEAVIAEKLWRAYRSKFLEAGLL